MKQVQHTQGSFWLSGFTKPNKSKHAKCAHQLGQLGKSGNPGFPNFVMSIFTSTGQSLLDLTKHSVDMSTGSRATYFPNAKTNIVR